MKKIILLFTLILIFVSVFSQEYKMPKELNLGPNNTNFFHNYVNIGVMMLPPDGEGVDILYGKSHTFTFGLRYKLKLAKFFALGTSVNYTYNSWHMNQFEGKIIPDNILYDKEKIMLHNLGNDIFIRFNKEKKEEKIGKYLDMGAYTEWVFSSSRKVVVNSENPENPIGEEYISSTNVHLNYINKINYGLHARIGNGKLVFFGKYRLSDIFTNGFKTQISSSQLPRLIIGVELGIHK